MYIFDFFKNLFKKSNIGTIIWMFLNTALICLVAVVCSGAQSWEDILIAIGVGLLVYLLSIAIALSPFGEWILRIQNGCRKIEDPAVLARLKPIFDGVYAKAKEQNPELPDNIKMYMSNDSSPNAFAMGRHTVCVTRGLLSMNDADIRGILGHEFGHLAHKDTDNILVIAVGNLIVSAIFVIWRVLFNIFAVILNFTIGLISESIGAVIVGALTRIFIDFILVVCMKLWTKLGVLICMASSRANEYQADRYSFELGYGADLSNALRKLDGYAGSSKGLWAALNSSHPDTPDRISRLNNLLAGNQN